MEGRCVVCRNPTGPLRTVCDQPRCLKRIKPCRQCGEPKIGQSPYCSWCRLDRLDGAELTRNPDWTARRGGRDARPARKPKAGPPVSGLHWCAGCRDWLHPRWFLRWKEYQKGRDIPPRCRACRSYVAHESRIKKEFGIDAVEYERLFALQGGVCAICGAQPRTARLAVDHDHSDGQEGRIRGLLCYRCNHELLGAAHDDINVLRRAIAYLEDPPAQMLGVQAG